MVAVTAEKLHAKQMLIVYVPLCEKGWKAAKHSYTPKRSLLSTYFVNPKGINI